MCTASVKINEFKKRCIMLAVICNYITIHGHMNIKRHVTSTFFFFIEMFIPGILWVGTKNLECLMWQDNNSRNTASNMIILCIVYVSDMYGPEKVNDTCRKIMHRRTMYRGFTMLVNP